MQDEYTETEQEKKIREHYRKLLGLPEKYIQHNFAFMDKEQHRAISSKGGKRSGEVRRQNAAYLKLMLEELDKQLFADLLEEEVDDFRAWQRHRRYLKKKREQKQKEGQT